jgi:hypothetical protein
MALAKTTFRLAQIALLLTVAITLGTHALKADLPKECCCTSDCYSYCLGIGSCAPFQNLCNGGNVGGVQLDSCCIATGDPYSSCCQSCGS